MNLTEAHRLLTDAWSKWITERPETQEKFGRNTKAKACLAFDGMWSDTKYRNLDDHTDLIKSLVSDLDMERLLGDAAFDAVYREARQRFDALMASKQKEPSEEDRDDCLS